MGEERERERKRAFTHELNKYLAMTQRPTARTTCDVSQRLTSTV